MPLHNKFTVKIQKRRWFLIGLAVALSLIMVGSDLLGVKAADRWGREPHKLLVKAVVVTMFEVGNDTGDNPGEFQTWVERENLNKVYPLPAAYHDVRTRVRSKH